MLMFLYMKYKDITIAWLIIENCKINFAFLVYILDYLKKEIRFFREKIYLYTNDIRSYKLKKKNTYFIFEQFMEINTLFHLYEEHTQVLVQPISVIIFSAIYNKGFLDDLKISRQQKKKLNCWLSFLCDDWNTPNSLRLEIFLLQSHKELKKALNSAIVTVIWFII
jgi:hypothetical protein